MKTILTLFTLFILPSCTLTLSPDGSLSSSVNVDAIEAYHLIYTK